MKLVIDHEGREFKTIKEACCFHGIAPEHFHYRRKRGITPDNPKMWAHGRRVGISHPVVDYEGRSFPSIEAAAEFHGITYSTLCRRLRSGMFPESRKTWKPKLNVRQITDHEGRVFASHKEAAIFHHLRPEQLIKRFSYGEKAEDARTWESVEERRRHRKGTLAKDHEGQMFRSINEMARHWGRRPALVNGRLNLGWSIEEALTIPPKEKKRIWKVYEVHGQRFGSLAEVARHYNLNVYTLHSRLLLHTLEEAIAMGAPKKGARK